LLHGRPEVALAVPHRSEALDWPDAISRHLLTADASALDLARRLLAEDVRLTSETRASIARDLDALAAADPNHFQAQGDPLEDLARVPEAALACRAIRSFGLIRHAANDDSARRESYVNAGIDAALDAANILGDTYLLCATAVEIRRLTIRHFSDQKTTVLQATRRLRWLSAEGAALDHVRAILEPED
jgi:hypothetical protein